MNNNEDNKNDDPLIMDHEYDGIKELDNPLPNYWVIGFIMTVVFAFLYSFYLIVMNGKTLREEYVAELKTHEEKMLLLKPKESAFNEEKLNSIFKIPGELKRGEEIFVTNCVACHKDQGQGDIGPNLTDEFWINGDGNKAEFLHHMVLNGREENGMPPWKEILSDDEVYHVVAYVKSLKGVKLPEAKAPQGTKYE